MAHRITRCQVEYDVAKVEQLKILMSAPQIDYYKIVEVVEAIFST